MENVSIDSYIIRDKRDFEALRESWGKVENGEDMTIFQSYNWNILLYEEEKKKKFSSFFTNIEVITVKDNDEIVGLMPLIIQKHSNKTKWFGRKRGIYILGHNSWSDYLNIVYSDKFSREHFNALMDYINKTYTGFVLYITDLRIETRFAHFLVDSGNEVISEEVAVQVEKMSTQEEYEQSLSKHNRQNLRTSKNRMEKAGIKYELKILGIIDDEDLIKKLIEIHIARMIEKNMITTDLIHRISSYIRIKYRKKRERCNNIISESMKKMNESCLVIAYLDAEIAGYLYGLRDKNVIRIMQNCVLDKYKFYSPLFRGAYDFILEQYSDDSIKAVDFTRGDEQYKYNLGGVEVKLGSWRIQCR